MLSVVSLNLELEVPLRLPRPLLWHASSGASGHESGVPDDLLAESDCNLGQRSVAAVGMPRVRQSGEWLVGSVPAESG